MKHGLDLEERLENLVITRACLSSNEERVVLYKSRRESRDAVGFVMKGDDSKSVRKSSTLIECRRRKVCCVGGGNELSIELFYRTDR